MYIIDKNKDYYDYYSHIFGTDKKITYDRRGSAIINNLDIVSLTGCEKISTDGKIRHEHWYWRTLRNPEYFVLLEIGFVQYLIKLFNFTFEKTELYYTMSGCSMIIERIFKDNKHYYEFPISIRGCVINSYWKNYKEGYIYKTNEPFEEALEIKNDAITIDNPILSGTSITSLIDPKEIWVELQSYISSLNNDKDISIPMTDIEKAETHGFDKKTSFRNPIK